MHSTTATPKLATYVVEGPVEASTMRRLATFGAERQVFQADL